MRILTDTCFWLHVIELYTNKIFDFRSIFDNFEWLITSEIKKELLHYDKTKFLNYNSIEIIDFSFSEIIHFQRKYPMVSHFDLADQSLIFAALEKPSIVVTDDGAIIMECRALKIKAFFLPQFLLKLVSDGFISKNLYYKYLHFWEKSKVYPKKQMKIWKNTLQTIN